MFQEELKKTSLSLNAEQYQTFKKICKVKHSDASKEIRKFMEQYLKENKQIVMNLNFKKEIK